MTQQQVLPQASLAVTDERRLWASKQSRPEAEMSNPDAELRARLKPELKR